MKKWLLLILFLNATQWVVAQRGFEFAEGTTEAKINFEQQANLIVIPVQVNGVEMNFILDTGATKTIIFNLKGIDTLNIRSGNYISVQGYGKENFVKAYYSIGNTVSVNDQIIDSYAEVLVLSENEIDVLPKIDMEINGLLGIDFFENFVTHIDYEDNLLKIYDTKEKLPRYLRKAKSYKFHLNKKRPNLHIGIKNTDDVNSYDILLDTGSGDALWILNEDQENLKIDNSFEDRLGLGINGEVFGLRSKVRSVKIFDYDLEKVTVSYPYEEFLSSRVGENTRKGSLGGEVLRRFDVVIDYPNQEIILKPNKYFDEGFYYNMSGLGVKKGEMELFAFVDRNFNQESNSENATKGSSTVIISSVSKIRYKYTAKIYVDYVRENSPADDAGIKIGDQILSINNYSKQNLTVSQVTELFFKNPYKTLKIKLLRGDQEFVVKIVNIPLVL